MRGSDEGQGTTEMVLVIGLIGILGLLFLASVLWVAPAFQNQSAATQTEGEFLSHQ